MQTNLKLQPRNFFRFKNDVSSKARIQLNLKTSFEIRFILDLEKFFGDELTLLIGRFEVQNGCELGWEEIQILIHLMDSPKFGSTMTFWASEEHNSFTTTIVTSLLQNNIERNFSREKTHTLNNE